MLIQLIIIQLITFIGLIFVLRVLFYRHLNSALTRLKNLHEENLSREEELKKELQEAQRQKEEELLNAKKQAERIIQEAKDRSLNIGVDMQSQAREQSQRIIEKAKEQTGILEAELKSKSMEQAVELSMEIFKFLFTEQGKQAFQRQLAAELIDEIGKISEDKFTVKKKEVSVVSASRLEKEDKIKLNRILSEKIGMAVEIEESVSPDIIAGLVVHIGALVIDGSLRSKLKKIAPYLKERA